MWLQTCCVAMTEEHVSAGTGNVLTGFAKFNPHR